MTTHARLDLATADFIALPDLLSVRAAEQPDKAAFIDDSRSISFAALSARMTKVAHALQQEGVCKSDAVAICCARNSIEYIEAFFGALRAGAVVAPLAPSSTAEALVAQLSDSGAKILFLDKPVAEHLGELLHQVHAQRISLDGSNAGEEYAAWPSTSGELVLPELQPDDPFNLIYSSGTTGAPKGIVQPHAMRWAHMRRSIYPSSAVTLISTPLYSNTTLVSLIPAIASGGTVVLMPKFDACQFLALSEKHRVTHTMLVPVQYQRLLAHPDFAAADLSSFQMKFATSAPFSAELKRAILDRWPGGLIEFYGMTEGGGTCALPAHEYPDKLHTVGRPLPGHDIRTIDEKGQTTSLEVVGEVVGRSPAMMTGYHKQPDKTFDAEWYSPKGERFFRTGDLGAFDEDGFLTLMGRQKDMIISGGFNIYPGDLEAILADDPAVVDVAVVGIPSELWGETPVGFVTVRNGQDVTADDIRAAANTRLGKTQRLSDVRIVAQLPRNAIGKVLKRDLRDAYR